MKDDKFYMLLDYAKNGDLAKQIKKMRDNKSYLTEAEVIPLIKLR